MFGDYTLAFLISALFGFIAAGLSLQINTRARKAEPAIATA
jgi:hypothetical protein